MFEGKAGNRDIFLSHEPSSSTCLDYFRPAATCPSPRIFGSAGVQTQVCRKECEFLRVVPRLTRDRRDRSMHAVTLIGVVTQQHGIG